ncbi:MAG: M23 family metallopeptidase, partial [Pseudomonadota bacterium]
GRAAGSDGAAAMAAVFAVFLCLFGAAVAAQLRPLSLTGTDRANAGPRLASAQPSAQPSTEIDALRSSVSAEAASAPLVFAPINAAPPNGFDAAYVEDAPGEARELSLTLASGQTLAELLIGKGVSPSDARKALAALQETYDARTMQSGEKIRVQAAEPRMSVAQLAALGRKPPTLQLASMTLRPSPEMRLEVEREGRGYLAREEAVSLVEHRQRARGVIESSLYTAANDAGMVDAMIVEFMDVFKYDVDFQRQVRSGDSFDALFSRFYDEEGEAIKSDGLIFAEMTVGGAPKAYYRFTTPDDNNTDYYDADGRSATKFLMKTPLNGAKLTSGFGPRVHPVLGYTKDHKGVDFGARSGTPIMAAGDGVVERASRFSTFGHYVRIRHSDGYKTIYAHLKGYAKGIKSGSRVRQGQIIGYVGSTGRSTGPHLHYEVHRHGKAVNPMRLKVATGRRLNGKLLQQFEARRSEIETLRRTAPFVHEVARAEQEPA